MPLEILAVGDQKLKITGHAPLKMSAFNITPLEFPLADTTGSKVKYEDKIDVSFQWLLGSKNAMRD
jgi:hypothetical protein